VIFLVAGMETVTTTLGNCIHILCKYPEEMKRLQDEIDEKFDFTLEVLF
jgi:cytochrome P450